MSENLPAIHEMPELRGTVLPNGLDLPEDLTFWEWEHEVRVLWWLHDWSPWALADALNYGAEKWPDRYEQAVEITGRKIKTLYNKTYLARKFPKEQGLRSEILTPAHHEVIAGIEDPDERRRWLKEGERLDRESGGHLTVPAFREYVREQTLVPEGATTQTMVEPEKCHSCFGNGVCPRCHGSGEEPSSRYE